jgi:hypothetical protein
MAADPENLPRGVPADDHVTVDRQGRDGLDHDVSVPPRTRARPWCPAAPSRWLHNGVNVSLAPGATCIDRQGRLSRARTKAPRIDIGANGIGRGHGGTPPGPPPEPPEPPELPEPPVTGGGADTVPAGPRTA